MVVVICAGGGEKGDVSELFSLSFSSQLFVKVHFEEDSRGKYLELLGYKKDDLGQKVNPVQKQSCLDRRWLLSKCLCNPFLALKAVRGEILFEWKCGG